MLNWRLSDDPPIQQSPRSTIRRTSPLLTWGLSVGLQWNTYKYLAPKSIKIHSHPLSSKAASFISCCCFCVAWRRSCRNSSLAVCGFAPSGASLGSEAWDASRKSFQKAYTLENERLEPENHLLENNILQTCMMLGSIFIFGGVLVKHNSWYCIFKTNMNYEMTTNLLFALCRLTISIHLQQSPSTSPRTWTFFCSCWFMRSFRSLHRTNSQENDPPWILGPWLWDKMYQNPSCPSWEYDINKYMHASWSIYTYI